MSEKERYLGFDPGGKGNFGWCVLDVEGDELAIFKSGTCSSAAEAFDQAEKALALTEPQAVGIDAPLHWVAQGDRPADKAVRDAVKKFGGQTSSVLSVNSLRGACLAQGVIIARRVRKAWPKCPIAEAHPKALLAVDPDVLDKIRMHKFSLECEGKLEHERDAVLAAYSAMCTRTVKAGWESVRSEDTDPVELTDEPFPLYWFPKELE